MFYLKKKTITLKLVIVLFFIFIYFYLKLFNFMAILLFSNICLWISSKQILLQVDM